MKKKTLLVLAIAPVLGGCAITSMDARLDPRPDIQTSQIGGGKVVAVSVVDERPQETLGTRSAGGGNIYMKDDLAAIYQTAIIDGLKRKGFNAMGSAAPDAATLKAEIRGLSQTSTAGLWTMGANFAAAMKVYAENGDSRYEQIYRADDEKRTLFVSGAKSLNKKMNAVVDAQLSDMLNDNMLLSVLAGTNTQE